MKKSIILLSAAALLSLAACGTHTHTFASEWSFDDTNHWHAATCEHTDQKDGVAAHTIGADGKCTVCDYTIPKDNKVTKEEWEAAFGLNKPYYMADNYNAVMRLIMEDETEYTSLYLALQVDSLKAKLTNKEVCTHEEEQFYVKVNNVYNAYLYGQKRENKWDLFEDVSNPARNFANFLEPIVGTYSSFTYNQNDLTYKCVSLDYEGTILTNVNIKFIDKKVVSCSYDSLWGIGEGRSIPFHWTFEITYGGQTVTLPEVDPDPGVDVNKVTEQEWIDAFGANNLDVNPFYLANNYKITARYTFEGQTETSYMIADGNKLKCTAGELYYWEVVDGTKYQYSQDEVTKKWSKQETSTTGADDYGLLFETFSANYSAFIYDETSNAYKLNSLDIEGDLFENIEIKFENKKIVNISSDVTNVFDPGEEESYHSVLEIVYGGQTVTLPEVDPEPSGEEYKVTETQFNTAFSLEGLNNVTITTSSGSFSQTCEADGTKEFNVNMKQYDFYLNKENGVMYEYKQEDDKWVKNQKDGTTYSREDLIGMFGNVYNQLTFDNDSNSYKGTNISIGGAVRYSEVEYCFENLKVVAINVVIATGTSRMTVTFAKYGQTVVTLPEVDPEPVPPGPSPSTGYTVTREEYESAISVEAFNNVSVYDTNEYLCYKFDGDNEEVFIYGHAILSHEDDTWYIYTESGGSWSRAVTQNPQSEREDLVYLLSSFDYDSLEYDETSHSYICLDESILSNFGMTYATFGFEDGVLLYWIMGNQQSSSGMIFTAYGTTAIDIPTVE